MNYCSECGYKIEGDFKFCPNCGNQIKTSADTVKEKIEVMICKNCGVENSPESENCFSCGVPLKGSNKKLSSSVKTKKKTDIKKDQVQKDEKVLDNKKILSISALVVIVFVLALVLTGVFDSGTETHVTQLNNQSTGSEVSLDKLDEIAELENKIKANPDDMESTLHLAHLSQDSGLLEKAIINYKKYLKKNPENADARVDMGICYYNLGDYTSAINEMETAIKYEPKHQIAHLNLGIVNLTAQNLQESKEWFRKAVEINPESEAGKRAQELLNSH